MSIDYLAINTVENINIIFEDMKSDPAVFELRPIVVSVFEENNTAKLIAESSSKNARIFVLAGPGPMSAIAEPTTEAALGPIMAAIVDKSTEITPSAVSLPKETALMYFGGCSKDHIVILGLDNRLFLFSMMPVIRPELTADGSMFKNAADTQALARVMLAGLKQAILASAVDTDESIIIIDSKWGVQTGCPHATMVDLWASCASVLPKTRAKISIALTNCPSVP
jgi:hypothetical protein